MIRGNQTNKTPKVLFTWSQPNQKIRQSFWFIMSSCQEVFSATNIPTITTDYLILPRLYKFGLFGDCSYTFVFNDSSVVRLKEYIEIHKQVRLLQLQKAEINCVILKKTLSHGISFSDFRIQSLQLTNMYHRVIKFNVVLGDLKGPFSSCILEKKYFPRFVC